jgi:hypothetical protein
VWRSGSQEMVPRPRGTAVIADPYLHEAAGKSLFARGQNKRKIPVKEGLMRVGLWWPVYLVFLFGFGAITLAQEAATPSPEAALLKLTPLQMRQDLEFLRDVWAKRDKSFSPQQTRAFNQVVADSIAQVDQLDSVAFWMQVSRAIALSGNGHTNINADNPPFAGLPWNAWWFRDGLYIVQTEPSYSQLLGARIDKFGTKSSEQALAAAAPLISGNERRVRNVSPKYLRIPALLHRLGMTDSDSEARLSLRLATGEAREVTLPLESNPNPSQSDGDNWTVLIPWLAGDHPILYLRSNEIEGVDGNPMSLEWKLLGIIATEVAPNHPKSVIVDLRLNSGGNFGNATLFAQALPWLLEPGGKVLVLVSASTFSAAIVTAAMLKEAGGANVVLIGEGMGDNQQFWAEGSRVSLPNSQLKIKAAWGFQDWGGPCSDLNRCFWPNVVWGPKHIISLRPEIEIEPY